MVYHINARTHNIEGIYVSRCGYGDIACAAKTTLANSRIYKSEECLPKWARNNSSPRIGTEEYSSFMHVAFFIDAV